MRSRRLLAVCVVVLAFVAAWPSFSQPSSSQSSTAAAKPKTTTAARPAYDRMLLKPALLKDKAPDTFQVKFVTTQGEFTITVHRDWSPLGADRFYNLVKHHYYDGARAFRVVPGFVVQFGISAYPVVTAAWHEADIKDDPRGQSNRRGTIVFATSGPNTRTTQVFINLKDNSFLDSQGFTPFGEVDGNGLSVVESFYGQYGDSAGLDQEPMEKGGETYIAGKWPKLEKITSATLVGAPATTATKPAVKATPKPQ
jgi:peptidyl-prolyl cis-trans isomerase A (cyclophilin A)